MVKWTEVPQKFPRDASVCEKHKSPSNCEFGNMRHFQIFPVIKQPIHLLLRTEIMEMVPFCAFNIPGMLNFSRGKYKLYEFTCLTGTLHTTLKNQLIVRCTEWKNSWGQTFYCLITWLSHVMHIHHWNYGLIIVRCECYRCGQWRVGNIWIFNTWVFCRLLF